MIDNHFIIECEYNNKNYFIISRTGTISVSDLFMAMDLNISTWRYRRILIAEFNAILYSDKPTTSYFETKKDASDAYDWYESILLMNKLSEINK
jgi:hypothetical protein